MIASIINWESDLWDQFDRLQRDVESLWGGPSGPASIRAVARGSCPRINVGRSRDKVHVYVFAAGLDRDRFDISVQQNLLTITGNAPDRRKEGADAYLQERFDGEFRRVLSLPDDIDPDSAKAEYRNGVLHISFEHEKAAQPRRIEINR